MVGVVVDDEAVGGEGEDAGRQEMCGGEGGVDLDAVRVSLNLCEIDNPPGTNQDMLPTTGTYRVEPFFPILSFQQESLEMR